jgi:Transposase
MPGRARPTPKMPTSLPRHPGCARDLAVIDAGTDLVRNLAVLTGHREDLIADRVRMINRLRDLMTSVFPSLKRAFDYSSHKGALVLLTGYATPDRIRRIGQTRLTR